MPKDLASVCRVKRFVLYEVGDRSRGSFKGFTPKLAMFVVLKNHSINTE